MYCLRIPVYESNGQDLFGEGVKKGDRIMPNYERVYVFVFLSGR